MFSRSLTPPLILKRHEKILLANEGTSIVWMSKHQLLNAKLENLKMIKKETIGEFNGRLIYIAKNFFYLNDKMSKEKFVRQVLRSLPKRFDMKVTPIEEEQDIAAMKVDKLLV